jgi:hypothetical protein
MLPTPALCHMSLPYFWWNFLLLASVLFLVSVLLSIPHTYVFTPFLLTKYKIKYKGLNNTVLTKFTKKKEKKIAPNKSKLNVKG